MESRDRATAQLSDQEINVLTLVAQGFDNESIAEALEIEKPTAGGYVYRIRCKTGLPNRKAMMALSPAQIEAYRRPTLSPREKQIAIYVAQGLTNGQIAKKLHPRIALHTVERHLWNISKKLNLVSRVQLAIYALKVGLIRLEDIELP